ncbi:MAG: hypothetical protein DRP85_08890 [Candidatus Makaraimicrobium thalassicum]|nr:MAG: hypothetical protein DRP85_08890 [Candidatus Omnitrophota bacterium]
MYKPIEIEFLDFAGLIPSMRAMRLPKGTAMDTFEFDRETVAQLGGQDEALARNLILAGPDHAKALRGVIVWLEIKMQVGFMVEFETYRHGIECLSTSSTMHTSLSNVAGEELAEKKQAGLEDLVYTRILTASYQALRAIYLARRRHRHPDWRLFCSFIETLPYSKELITLSGRQLRKS